MSDTVPSSSSQAHLELIARETGISLSSVTATAKLLAEGATIPFISRYRKEATGMLDEVQIQAVRDRMLQLAELDSRRASILKSLDERKLLSDELKKKVLAALTITALEDIFAPYRPKRQTRATKAIDRGLEPLADFLLENQNADPAEEAAKFINESEDKELAVTTAEDALAGARDIIAERVADDAALRGKVREIYTEEATVSSRIMYGKEEEVDAAKFRDYFEWSEPFKSIPSHRMLAIRRGEKEAFLFMRVEVPLERVSSLGIHSWVTGKGGAGEQVRLATEDGCKRLLMPSMETEMRLLGKKRADETAIQVFAENLRELMLASPLGRKRTLAIDPGFRTGCKTVVLDAQGNLLHHTVLHCTAGSNSQLYEAATEVVGLIKKHDIQAIAIGNGTASRETESFIKKLKLPASIQVIMVNESGASIYSASDAAREEFPNEDVTVRGAVSIGRRLMDPLAELVKIDPKAIGVGQYQHDVDQRALKTSLDDTVESCVNGVGVELNTASKHLLAFVSGLSNSIAENIIAFRTEKGGFTSRAQLLEVPRLGEKAFEQAAGFLRIRDAAHPLDASAVHPERYALVEKMAADLGCSVSDLIQQDSLRQKINLQAYVSEEVGLPTLKDIVAELAKPGRDPRKAFEAFTFAEGVEKPSDLTQGLKLPGIVTNVTAFGAFVDVGVHQDGLVHVSQLSDQFVRDPAEVVKVGQKVQVTVMEVDLKRNRIGLSMKSNPDFEPRQRNRSPGGNERRPQQNRRPQQAAPAGNDWFSQAMGQAKKR
ncbi:MAG: RNA-binding transcriptional accessory protein [Akkermansiaceae bacterium]|nr:RNA-binding transcriptional accessory protein [Akkermansiaceae bacterium]MDP4646269.1 RNA-binding transcriptional accessory protein [Akkermansiaceae bacterium]MDP4779890.1 RNA-binding transcriptional accessory protein [Akkermansiaceae bacterium]MDP4845857.1 RNA-binding transcriptional accessory protein [Akkermansiaceae bacterium]MDP4994947.1 RNA-binding transcriptional accessory protein [Akkermansiaceae bacterium]